MTADASNLPPEDELPGESPAEAAAVRPRNEAELLDRESVLARAALRRLRGEILDSLGRTADVGAWGERYPWPTMGAAAVAGIGAGWALGKAIRGKSYAEKAADAAAQSNSAQNAAGQHPAARMVGGLGTLAGAFASAAVGAATEAVTKVIRESIHDSLRPEDPGEPTADGTPQAEGDDDPTAGDVQAE